jgi:RNA polymerase sigma-70 factor, ECF subfamily
MLASASTPPQNESLLVQRLKGGDDAAFREFVRFYQRPVFALAMQLLGNSDDADDLTQEVFIKANGSIAAFQGASLLSTWLHRIAVNLYIDFTRSGRYRTMTAWNDERDNQATSAFAQMPHTSPESSADAQFQHEYIQQALQTLSPQQRAVFTLRHFEDLSLEEIATALGVSTGTVKTQLFRAIRQLRERLSFFKGDLALHTNTTNSLNSSNSQT